MTRLRSLILSAAIATASFAAVVLPASAAFFGWRVSGVAANDVLNVRKWPASYSQILVGYPNGTPLSLTGKCTGGVNLNNINGWPASAQRQAVRYLWCEVWVDPVGNGSFQTGWVYGKFIRPL